MDAPQTAEILEGSARSEYEELVARLTFDASDLIVDEAGAAFRLTDGEVRLRAGWRAELVRWYGAKRRRSPPLEAA